MAKTKVKAVIFDLGRVIVNLHPEKGLFKYFIEPDKVFDEANMMNFATDPLAKKYMSGLASPEEFHSSVCERFGLDLDFENFSKHWCSIFTLNEETAQIINDLSNLTNLGLLSDVDPLHWNHLKTTYSVLDHFKLPTLSYEVGVTKPAKEIFIAAAKNVNTPAENCLFVDDLMLNVQGAIDAGMQGVQFTSARKLRKELVEYDLLKN